MPERGEGRGECQGGTEEPVQKMLCFAKLLLYLSARAGLREGCWAASMFWLLYSFVLLSALQVFFFFLLLCQTRDNQVQFLEFPGRAVS